MGLLIMILLLSAARSVELRFPEIRTKLGVIRGLQAKDGDYNMYLGVPYARVNESNPFGLSIPNPAFEEVFEAFDDTVMCPQREEFNKTVVGDLDCLHLNIYVPNSASSKNLLPILIWIHGGGGNIGGAGRYLYGPKYLVQHDIIFISFNYRLGPYGFMCLGIPEASGNEGLKDQVKALRWIHDNIEDFGGDPTKMTIYGSSSAAGDVEMHLMKEETDFIDKAILSSGGAASPYIIVEPNISAPFILSKYFGNITYDLKEAILFLGKIDPKSLIEAVVETDVYFGPCIEKRIDGVQPFHIEYQINLKPELNVSSVMLGYNNDETLITYDYAAKFASEIDFSNVFDFDETRYREMEVNIRDFYVGSEPDASPSASRNFFQDFYFLFPTEISTQMFLRAGVSNIYRYLFSYTGKRNFNRYKLNATRGGAMHADEVSYIFDISYMPQAITEEDQLIIDRMTTLWANFVKYGDPTPQTSKLLPFKWDPITEDSLPCLNINLNMSTVHRPFRKTMAFYDLFYEANKQYLKKIESGL